MIDLDNLVANPGLLTGGRSYAQVLTDVRNLLADQDKWNQGTFAVDVEGAPVGPTNPNACRWCLLGALARCSSDLGITPPQLLRYVQDMMHFKYQDKFATVGEMNDYIDHSSLLIFIDQCLQQFRQ